MQIVSLTLIVLLFAAAGVLLSVSPGHIRPVTDTSGKPIPESIAEKTRVPINGAEQGMVIRCANPANPVLLFVHGGPGLPEYFLDATRPTRLEREFTVVWWDQRGAGLSYRAGSSAESMTVEQFVDDTIAVTDYLRERFGQDKNYLLGHSWGSAVGIRAAARAPERYRAYIGMGQITHQIESEKPHTTTRSHATASRGHEDGPKLEASPFTTGAPLPRGWNAMRDGLMHGLGVGTTRDMDRSMTGVFLALVEVPRVHPRREDEPVARKDRSQESTSGTSS